MFNPKFVNNPNQILNLDIKENEAFLNIENQHNIDKSFLENRFSYIIDSNDFSNNILFHLELANQNENSGLTQNEINLVTGFMGREKSIGRILTNLKNANLIKNMPMRAGRKYEFLYFINNRNVLPKYLFKIIQYFKKKKIQNKNQSLNYDNYSNITYENHNDLSFENSDEYSFLEESLKEEKYKPNLIIKIKRKGKKNELKYKYVNCDEVVEKSNYNVKEGNLLAMANPEFFTSITWNPIENDIKNDCNNQKEKKSKNSKNKKKKNKLLDESGDEDLSSEYKPESDEKLNFLSFYENNVKNQNRNLEKNNNNTNNNVKNKIIINPLLKTQNEENISIKNCLNSSLTYKTKYKYTSNSAIININPTEDVEFVDLNKQDFLFILQLIIKESQYNSIVKQNETYLHKDNYEKLNQDKKLKRNILLDFFHANSDKLNLKSLSFISFNRYLYCLNKLHEFNLLLAINMKHLIINELECKTGYSIDRKTLQKILNNLHQLGLIKVMEYEIIMKNKIYNYSNNRSEIKQNKIIAMRRDIVENQDLYNIIEYLIKPRCQSKNQNPQNINIPGLHHLELVKNLKVYDENLKIDEEKKNENIQDILNIDSIKEENKQKPCLNNLTKNIKENQDMSSLEFEVEKNNGINFKNNEIRKKLNEKTGKKESKSLETINKISNNYSELNIYKNNNEIQTKDFEVDKFISKDLFGEKHSNIKIKSNLSSICKLVEILEKKFNNFNEIFLKNKFFDKFKKLYFVKKNLLFIFDNFNEKKDLDIDINNLSHNNLEYNNYFNCKSNNNEFFNIFKTSEDKDFLIKNKSENYYNLSILKELPLFKLVENYKTNDIIIPNFLKEKIFKKDNEGKEIFDIFGKDCNNYECPQGENEEEYKILNRNFKNQRHLNYSSCLLSEKEIKEERNNIYYFNTDEFIRESYKNNNVNLNESEKLTAKKLFSNNKFYFNCNEKEKNFEINSNFKKDEKIFNNFIEKKDIIMNLLKNKKKRDISDSKKLTKLIDFHSVLFFIYFNPKTTLKKIKKVFKYNEAFSDLLIYFANMDLINIKVIPNINSITNLSTKEIDIELQLDENINNFIDFY